MALPNLKLSLLSLLCLPLSACLIHIDTDHKDWGVGSRSRSSSLARIHGSGVIVSESRELATIERVHLEGGSFEVRIQCGAADQHVQVRGDSKCLSELKTHVIDGVLTVDLDARFDPSETMEIELTLPQLRSLSISGSATVDVDGAHADVFELAVSGSGDVEMAGEIGKALIDVSGSANLDLSQLATKESQLAISGSANVDVQASESLIVRISGSGSVVYSGNPRIEQSISGSGSLRTR